MTTVPAGASPVRRSEAAYPGTAAEIGAVRAALRPLLDGGSLADDVILCVCELATNAVLHSRSGASGGCFTVRAEIHGDQYVRVEVEDQGGSWEGQEDDTSSVEARPEDQRGHGLEIVAALASDWGIDGDRTGRLAWFRIDWPSARREADGGGDAAVSPAK